MGNKNKISVDTRLKKVIISGQIRLEFLGINN